MARAFCSRGTYLMVRNEGIVKPLKMTFPYRCIARFAMSDALRVNLIGRTTAFFALGFASSGTAYAVVYVWWVALVAENYPHTLRMVSANANRQPVNLRLTSSAFR